MPPTQSLPAPRRELFWLDPLFRLACGCEFVGHGAFGLLVKPAWLPYLSFWHLDESRARFLMPVVGVVDITLGLLVLIQPRRGLLAWMSFWGLITAVMRPLTGESVWEALDRSANFLVPFA